MAVKQNRSLAAHHSLSFPIEYRRSSGSRGVAVMISKKGKDLSIPLVGGGVPGTYQRLNKSASE
eukprot:COSAG02_NODE_2392_length_8974_cov_2.135437_2_plen_64_part_00